MDFICNKYVFIIALMILHVINIKYMPKTKLIYIYNIFFAGMLWPLEGMPTFLYYFAKLLPSTIPIESLHDILERGRSIVESRVYNGYLVTLAWIFIQVGLCLVILQLKSK